MDHGFGRAHLTVTPAVPRRPLLTFVVLASLLPLLTGVAECGTPGLSDAAARRLDEHGYVVLEGDLDDFESAYARVSALGLPAFITGDSVLWLSDRLFDDVQRTIEE